MKKYFRVYSVLLRQSFAALVIYRANFINNIISSISWGFFSLFSIILLTSRTQIVHGWRREEMLLFNGIYGIVMALFHMFISVNMDRFAQVIHLGNLDSWLVKPIDTQFAISFWKVSYTHLIRVFIAGLYTWYILGVLHISLSPSIIFSFLIVASLGMTLLYSIWFIAMTSLIWNTNLRNLVNLMFTLTGIARYPQEISKQILVNVLVVLFPLTLIINIPTKILLHRVSITDILTLIILALILFLFSRKFWKFALRYYTSASS